MADASAADASAAEARVQELARRVAELEQRLDALTAVLNAPYRAESPARRMSLDLLDQFEFQHLRD